MLEENEYRYLKKQGKRIFKMSRQEVVRFFEPFEIDGVEPFVDFQCKYAGYRLNQDLTLGIVSPSESPKHEFSKPRIDDTDDLLAVRCDLLNYDQVRYWMDTEGTFYEDAYKVAESFENYVRFTVFLRHTIQPEGWTYLDQCRLATKKFEGFYDEAKMTIVAKVSDRWHQVLQNENMICLKMREQAFLYVRPEYLKKQS